jgi:F-type H+-transporting ATPase subunit a
MAEQHSVSSSEYIKHHLTNLTYGNSGEGWKLAETSAEAKAMGFNAFHIDSLSWSIGLGLIFCFMLRLK